MDLGLEPQTADQHLKMFLRKSVGSADAPLWDLLPFMYALSFHSTIWKEAVYKSILESHANNAHVIMKTIHSLTIAFKVITSGQQDERIIFNLEKTFVDVASLILLRLSKPNDRDKRPPVDYPSMIAFLDTVTHKIIPNKQTNYPKQTNKLSQTNKQIIPNKQTINQTNKLTSPQNKQKKKNKKKNKVRGK